MSYKQPPDNSYDRFDTLEEYVDNYFTVFKKPYIYKRDVEPLFRLKHSSFNARGKEIEITGRTFKKWLMRYNMEHETSTS